MFTNKKCVGFLSYNTLRNFFYFFFAECGISIQVDQVKLAETTHGDWETEEVRLGKKREDRNYIDVSK